MTNSAKKDEENVTFKARFNAKVDRARNATIKTKIMTMAFAFVIAIVFVSIFFPLRQDPDTFTDPIKRSEWINNTVITSTLSIVGLILCESIITDKIKSKERGRYQCSINGYYLDDGKKVEGYSDKREKARKWERDFSDWLDWYCAEELKKKKLSTIGSRDAEAVLKHLDEITNPLILCDHIEVTKKHWWSRKKAEEVKGIPITLEDGTVIERKTEDEVRGILKVKNGEVRIYPYEAPYYLNLDSITINVSRVDKAYILNKTKQENQVFSRTFKIVVGFIVSIYWALVTVDNFNNLVSAKAWMLLIIRLGTLMGGVVSGWSGADMNVKFDTDMIVDRSAMLDTFNFDMESGRFNPDAYKKKLLRDEEEKKRKEAEENDGNRKKAVNADGKPSPVHVGEKPTGDPRQPDTGRVVSEQNPPVPVEAP